MKRIMLIVGCVFTLTACEARVNTSNAQTFASSMNAMTKDMTSDKKSELQQSLVAIAFDSSDPSSGFMSGADLTSPMFLAAGDKIKGKTANEIIRLGYQTQINKLDQEIAEDAASVQRTKADREKYRAIFDNIHIDNPRYSVESSMFIKQPLVSFSITNGSAIPIKKIFLHGTLSSPGRSLPWISADLNYEFTGGLEAQETKILDLEPNMFSAWKVDPEFSNRPDLNLVLTVVNVENVNGEALLKGDPGDSKSKELDASEKQNRKSELQAKLAKL